MITFCMKKADINVTREEAYQIANRLIPETWGSLRTAWINGFIGYPEEGVAKYPKTSVAYQFRKKGAVDRQRWNRQT